MIFVKVLMTGVLLLSTITYAQTTGNFTDSRDGKTYKTVEIGSQVWMAENLAYKPSSGNYWAYDDNQSNVAKYGYLYDWQTAKNVCPSGWHLPSLEEWKQLTKYLGGKKKAGAKMISEAGGGQNGNGNNEIGFSALPGGMRFNYGDFGALGKYGYWWSTEPFLNYTYSLFSTSSWVTYLNFKNGNVNYAGHPNEAGASVRCLRD
jgi:uncharacterized protein (TIGR02145 family)